MGIKKMKNRFIRHVLILLLCGFCHTAAFAYGYDRNDQSKAWGYQPVYQSTATTSYVSAAPTYQFRSTSSVYLTSSGHPASYVPGQQNNGPRRIRLSDPFDPTDEDEPIGAVTPQPIGDTPWLFLLILAAGYLAFRYRKKIRTQASADGRFCYFFLLYSRCAFFNCLRYALLVCKRAKAALATTRAASTSLCQWKPAMTRL